MDAVFQLISTNMNLPRGWGFPDTVSVIESPESKLLFKSLVPYEDSESRAQLVRWYYGLIRSFPSIALGMGTGDEEYVPGMAWKPSLEIVSSEIHITADPVSGMVQMKWTPDGNEQSLEGRIFDDGGLKLELGATTYELPTASAVDGSIAITWPEFLSTRAGLTAMPTVSTPIRFRPSFFSVTGFLARVEPAISKVGTGTLKRFWYHAGPEEKLALSWAILQNLRYGR